MLIAHYYLTEIKVQVQMGTATDWMFVSPQNSYLKTLIINVMVFGSGAFGALINEISDLIRDRMISPSLPTMWDYSKKTNQKERPHWEMNQWAPLSWTFQPLER